MSGPSPSAAAGYLAAVLNGDQTMIAAFRIAYTADELLIAIAGPLRLMARYLGYHTDKTPTEIGDALVCAAGVQNWKEASA